MRCSGLVLALSAMGFLGGCGSVVSVRPLYVPSDIQHPLIDPRIGGEWIVLDSYGAGGSGEMKEFTTRRATVVSPNAGLGTYSVEFRDVVEDEKKSEGRGDYNYDLQLVPLGGKVYFDAEFTSWSHGQSKLLREELSIPVVTPAHFLGRVTVEPEFLRVEVLNPEWIEHHVSQEGWERTSIERYTDIFS